MRFKKMVLTCRATELSAACVQGELRGSEGQRAKDRRAADIPHACATERA
jgi:hypothetical protein